MLSCTLFLSYILKEEVKPGFTNYQPQGVSQKSNAQLKNRKLKLEITQQIYLTVKILKKINQQTLTDQNEFTQSRKVKVL